MKISLLIINIFKKVSDWVKKSPKDKSKEKIGHQIHINGNHNNIKVVSDETEK